MASLKSRCFLFIFIILVFILDFTLVRKLVFLYFNVNVYLNEIPCLNKVTLPYLTLDSRPTEFFLKRPVWKDGNATHFKLDRDTLTLWVPEVFLACHGREFSVLAEGRQIFGCRPRPRAAKLFARVTIKTWQKPETELEKYLAPRVLINQIWTERPIANSPQEF